MKVVNRATITFVLSIFILVSNAQSGMTVTNSSADKILKGTYTPSTYNTSGLISDPNLIASDLQSSINADSLALYVRTLANFGNRNTMSLLGASPNNGLNVATTWVKNKFQQFSAKNNNRLQVSDLTYNATICGVTSTFSEPFAVLPGSDITDKSLIVLIAHLDSRNSDGCDWQTNPAPGVSDNATGSALVVELARIISKYNLKASVVFITSTGEEQSLWGGHAFANYLSQNNVTVRMVQCNDIAATTYCGNCSSSPSCIPGNIATNSLRIFSLGTGSTLTAHKQVARFIKLEYNEQILPITNTPMTINIMATEDRINRGSDHKAFSSLNYSAVRIISQNENGDGSSCGVQHTSNDNEIILNNAGNGNVSGVDFNYLQRNAIINANAICMAGQSVTTPQSFSIPASVSYNTIPITITDPSNAPGYRITVRSNTDDWDSVYTVYTKTPTITIALNNTTTRYISVAAINANNTESLFTLEQPITVPLSTVLPITGLELNGNTAANCKINLQWNTKSETNSDNFEIMQSEDGVGYTPIGTIAAAGFSSLKMNYFFNYNPSSNDVNYFKIKANCKDGTYSFSNTIALVPDCNKSGKILIYPNPVTHSILYLDGIESGTQMGVYDVSGKILLNQKSSSNNIQHLNLSNFAKGIYLLKILSPALKNNVFKIIKD